MSDAAPQTAWLVLIVAGLLEIVWAIALKHAEGFTRLWPSVLGIGVSLASFILLALALRSLPVGTAYAIWVGIGTLGVAVAGILTLGEPATLARLGFLALIVIGVAGLRLIEK
jgi:quaternary ammonium compound-resistance protein SugE